MATDKYLWTWELADELMIPYLTDNKDDIANADYESYNGEKWILRPKI